MFSRKNRRESPAINAGSMADIAFLLLIFFLVTAVILEDKGILVRLPIWTEDQEPIDVNEHNVLSVKINSNNQLLVESTLTPISAVREKTKRFIMNPEKSEYLPSTPKNAVISIQHDKGTKYESYLEVYNELKAAYNELWEERALELHGKSYDQLDGDRQKSIRDQIPLVISEAEPTDYQGPVVTNN